MPRLNLPIVHIVPDAAIRKFILKEGIVGESCPRRFSNHPGVTRSQADELIIGNRSGSIGIPEDLCQSTDGDEAGGNAMRRPPEVGQVGLLAILLLGASGCAGFPQRSSGTSPWAAPSNGESVSPPGLFSWWHGPGSQPAAAPSSPSGPAETARPEKAPAAEYQAAVNPWPESRSEWLARSFPRFNRLWNGTANGNVPDGSDTTRHLSTSRSPAKPPAPDTPVTASVARSDREVPPTDGEVRATDGESQQENTKRTDQTNSEPQTLQDILPAPALAGPQELLSAGGAAAQATDSSAGSKGTTGLTSDAEPPPTLDSRLAQVPPAPPPVRRTPPAPSPSGGERPASAPPKPPAPPATPSLAAEKPVAATPAPPSPTIAAPAPATAQSDASPQNVLPTGQGNQAVCEVAKKPCFLKVWIHDLKSGGHCSHGDGCQQGGASASPQGNAAVCETSAKAPKKPCFLKVWIHDLKSGCHGAGCGRCQKGEASGCCKCKCGGSGTPVMASSQGGIASAQGGSGQIVARP